MKTFLKIIILFYILLLLIILFKIMVVILLSIFWLISDIDDFSFILMWSINIWVILAIPILIILSFLFDKFILIIHKYNSLKILLWMLLFFLNYIFYSEIFLKKGLSLYIYTNKYDIDIINLLLILISSFISIFIQFLLMNLYYKFIISNLKKKN